MEFYLGDYTTGGTMKETLYPHGVLITGNIPISQLVKIESRAARHLKVKKDELVVALQVGRRLRGMAISTSELMVEWTAALDLLPVPRVTGLEWLDTWMDRGEVGASSATIAVHVGGVKWDNMGMMGPGKPMDAADFGRCHKLLELAEANGCNWRERLVANPPPGWEALAGAWDQLTVWYVRVEYAILDAALTNMARNFAGAHNG